MGERFLLRVPGGEVEVDTTAGDPSLATLVFLHEGLGSIDLWRGFPDDVRAALGEHPTVVYSRHGYGRSAPATMPRPVDYMHHEADVVLPALVAELEMERPWLIGHSDGASIALLYAGAGRPVAGIVSLAAHVFVEDASVAGVAAATTAFETTAMSERMGRYHHDPVATFRGWSDVWSSAEFRDWNIEDRLPTITAPVLAVQGHDDEYGTMAQLDAIEQGVAGPCRRVEIVGVGHAPHLDARERVIAEIVDVVRGS